MGQPDPSDTTSVVPLRTDSMISARAVCEITGLSPRRVREAAAAGHLTVMRAPAGVRALTRYSKASALALARSMVVPATSTLIHPTEVSGES